MTPYDEAERKIAQAAYQAAERFKPTTKNIDEANLVLCRINNIVQDLKHGIAIIQRADQDLTGVFALPTILAGVQGITVGIGVLEIYARIYGKHISKLAKAANRNADHGLLNLGYSLRPVKEPEKTKKPKKGKK